MPRAAPGRHAPHWRPLLGLAVAGGLALTACAAPAWSAAGETAVARDTAGPTVVILRDTPVSNSASQTAAAMVQTLLALAPTATPLGGVNPTRISAADIELTLQPCASQDCAAAAGHLWLARPIPGDEGFINYVERSYPYGSTQGGQREPHHGVEFFNPAGTPVLAAARGVVVVAGADTASKFGPTTNFYGNLVVIEHEQTDADRPVYTLYGHMRSVNVEAGQRVEAGDLVGVVGSTGVAIGAHLHFEVRVGANTYASTRNPELWLLPLPYDGQPQGVIAGRVLGPDGHWLPELTIAIRPISTESDRPRNRFIQTYTDDPALNADDRLQENFAIGDMPIGLYSVSVNTTKFYQQNITVYSGQVTWVTFVVNPPLPNSGGDPLTETPPTDATPAATAPTAPVEGTPAPEVSPAVTESTPTPAP